MPIITAYKLNTKTWQYRPARMRKNSILFTLDSAILSASHKGKPLTIRPIWAGINNNRVVKELFEACG
jgi:hypothetical protein